MTRLILTLGRYSFKLECLRPCFPQSGSAKLELVQLSPSGVENITADHHDQLEGSSLHITVGNVVSMLVRAKLFSSGGKRRTGSQVQFGIR